MIICQIFIYEFFIPHHQKKNSLDSIIILIKLSLIYQIKKFQIYFKYKFVLKVKKKRPGDVAYLVCNNKKIKKLGWKPKYKNLDNCLNESYKYFRKYFFLKN